MASAERWGFGGKINLAKMKEMQAKTPLIIRRCVSENPPLYRKKKRNEEKKKEEGEWYACVRVCVRVCVLPSQFAIAIYRQSLIHLRTAELGVPLCCLVYLAGLIF